MNNYIFALIILLNIITSIVFIYDKYSACKHKSRISENTLMILSLIGGATSLYLLMYIINHKTRKTKFTFFIPVIIIIQYSFLLFIL